MISILTSNTDKLDNTVVAAMQLVKTLNIKITDSEIRRKLQWSPSYPSINSIQSFLKQWDVDTVVLDVDKDNLDKLPPVFLCHLANEKDSFKIITNHDATSVQWLIKDNEKVSVPINEFLEKWSGVVLLAEKKENGGMPDFKSVRRMEWWERHAITIIVLTLFVSTIANVFVQSNITITASLAAILLQLANITGIFICVALVRYLIDDTDDAVKKLCTAGKNANDCTKIVNATDAKAFGFSWAEIGLVWFLGASLCIATIGVNIADCLFSIAAIFFIPYSIYYQTSIAKQWCVICLYILGIITIRAGLYLYLFASDFLIVSPPSFFQHLFGTLCCIFLPAICWLAIKRFTFNRKALLLAEQGYFKLKHNPLVYNLLQTDAAIVDTSTGSPVSFNAGQHEFEITIVSSLSCGPCGEAHKLIEKVIRNNPHVCFKIYILPIMDPTYNTVQHLKVLLTILEEQGTEAFLDALHYWYHIACRDCVKFFKRYPEKKFSPAVENKVIEMGSWISEYNVEATPSYFVNGKAMPETYGVEDILAMVSNF